MRERYAGQRVGRNRAKVYDCAVTRSKAGHARGGISPDAYGAVLFWQSTRVLYFEARPGSYTETDQKRLLPFLFLLLRLTCR